MSHYDTYQLSNSPFKQAPKGMNDPHNLILYSLKQLPHMFTEQLKLAPEDTMNPGIIPCNPCKSAPVDSPVESE